MALSNIAGWNENKTSGGSLAGSACGASEKPAACGSACGAGDKPVEAPAACGASDEANADKVSTEKPAACGA